MNCTPSLCHQAIDLFPKLCLWCIVIPLIGIPAMIVAAEAIPNDLPANKLYCKSLGVIQGLISVMAVFMTSFHIFKLQFIFLIILLHLLLPYPLFL